jgi:hypothetical protein
MGVHRDRVRGGHRDPISPQRHTGWSSGHSRDSAGADSDRKPEPAKDYVADPHTGKRMQALAEAAGAGAFVGMVIVSAAVDSGAATTSGPNARALPSSGSHGMEVLINLL